ncbi:uncharacterized protein BDV17DRAFT_92813 [Aspergillus undulatus]|uniref:uncharacterized protein n=1 Tax=Aspergillus undulatus TaxID=1810928 RepID=UPI003CCDDE72
MHMRGFSYTCPAQAKSGLGNKRRLPPLSAQRAQDPRSAGFSMLVMHNKARKMLTGRMDYLVQFANDKMAIGLTIINVNSLFKMMGIGKIRCLACMAMIHHIRKAKGFAETVVWGIVSDSMDYEFLRIDNNAMWCSWRPPNWWIESTEDKIYTTLRLVIRSAAKISTRTSSKSVEPVD